MISATRYRLVRLAVLAVLLLLASTILVVGAKADGALVLERFDVASNWPSGARVDFAANSSSEIVTIIASVSSGRGRASVVRRPSFTPGTRVAGSFDVSPGGVPPFGIIIVQLSFEDSAGNRLKTEVKQVRYIDSRYQWLDLSDGLVTVHYHGEVGDQAPKLLAAATRTLDEVAKQAGTRYSRLVQLVVYNSKPEMDSVLGFRSATTQRELVILGQAQYEHDLVLVQAGPQAEVTTAHELTHLVTASATENRYLDIPVWLNEGLSVYFEGDGGPEYRAIFERAKREGKLLSVRALTSLPGKPEENLLMYGQGYQLVKYLIDTYGPAKMADYLAAYKTAPDHEAPLRQVYGLTRDQLDSDWRKAIGVPDATPSPDEPVAAPERRSIGGMIGSVLVAAGVIAIVGIAGLTTLVVVLRKREL